MTVPDVLVTYPPGALPAPESGQAASVYVVTDDGVEVLVWSSEGKLMRDDWQPIETAPDADDVWIVLLWAHGRVVWGGRDDDGWFDAADPQGGAVAPTHWMHLPTPPSNQEGGRDD